MNEQKNYKKIFNIDLSQPEGVERDTFLECLNKITNEEIDLPF